MGKALRSVKSGPLASRGVQLAPLDRALQGVCASLFPDVREVDAAFSSVRLDEVASPRRGAQPEAVLAARSAERGAQCVALAMMAARWFDAAGYHISFTFTASDFVRGGGPVAGLLAAAVELRSLLAKTADGRKALRDLGFEPVPQNVEGE